MRLLGVKLPGKVAVSFHSGSEVGNQNFIRQPF